MTEEIKKEIERAEKSLRAAKALFKEELYEDSISRAYYSTLHSAKAALLMEGVSATSHDAVKNLFGLHLVKPGKIDKKYSIILREEQDDRYLADYNSAFSPSEEQVKKRIEDAERFFNEMRSFTG